MFARRVLVPLLLAVVLAAAPVRAQRRFEVWYPQYEKSLLDTIHNNCSAQWDAFATKSTTVCHGHICNVLRLMDCMLSNSHETIKANMANAGILLGSLPTTLGFIGTSTVEMGLLAARRPVLAALLAAGSPSVSPLRTIAYRGPLEVLQQGLPASALGLGRSEASSLLASWPAIVAVSAAQYLLAAAAVGNLGHVVYQLCIQVVYSFSPAMRLHPAVWLLLGLAVHGGGTYAVWLRVRLHDVDEDKTAERERDWAGRALAWLRGVDEFRPCALQRPATLRARPERLWFVLVAWATATGTVMHIIYGTLVFSSALFIGTRDAFFVLARVFLSMVACRIILMFELSGLRDCIRVVEEELPRDASQDFALLQQPAYSDSVQRQRADW